MLVSRLAAFSGCGAEIGRLSSARVLPSSRLPLVAVFLHTWAVEMADTLAKKITNKERVQLTGQAYILELGTTSLVRCPLIR